MACWNETNHIRERQDLGQTAKMRDMSSEMVPWCALMQPGPAGEPVRQPDTNGHFARVP
eukprot:CAMPEP_0182810660 /NCGR_PEP_ID=MMETSP0006_2-20121128/7859_1 /TAXON_ID=97485 /ORGANISM="Prymnesium parvum, Strain Texoma1" /LENGTH=58 /DNA_ID=CAMNT_0024936573 /DNA_START=192 /DNA_END=364 /DNA_ORIENTATION=-